MKKIMKRLVSVALVLTLLLIPFSYLLSVKAEPLNITVDADKKVNVTSTITVKTSPSITSLTGDTLVAYKVLDAYYDSVSNQLTYDFTDNFKNFKTSAYATTDNKDFSTLTVDEYVRYGAKEDANTTEFELLVAQFAKYVKANTITDGVTLTVSSDGAQASAEAKVGSYLVLPTVTLKIFTAMLGNVEIAAENGAWVLKPAEIVAKGTTIGDSFADSQYNTGKTKSILSKGHYEASVIVGKDYKYIVSTALPKYPTNASNTTFVITETLADTIDFAGIDTMEIYDGGMDNEANKLTNDNGTFKNSAGQTVASVTVDGQKIVISFNPNNAGGSQLVDIVYKARLNASANNDYTKSHLSSSVLKYAVDPYGAPDSTLDTVNKTTGASVTYARTYGFRVENVEQGDNNQKLSGANFELYDSNQNKIDGTFTADGAGVLNFSNGLAEGQYTLKQIKAPAGYTVASPITFTLTASDAEDYFDVVSASYTVTVANTKAGLLPATGGLGTILYTLIGLFIITFSATAVVYYRKKKTATNE